ncbi:MAG: 16S rRNA (cytosine(1402)-N(4))-methyltransferase RsmH [Planctomycetes bacterium]|nr:16S rRNA (cytosine(1402)-N(4))-methyltransferase RsmH [Planctomycetota bacterium]
MSESTCHIPVLLQEILHWLQPAPGKILVDGTLGGGGHTAALASRVGPEGQVIAVDLDPQALERASQAIGSLPVKIVAANYTEIPQILGNLGLNAVDGILLDLGLSSDQLADEDRGFSFHSEGELDLRFDRTRGKPAWQLIERLSERHLADLIYQYGEERLSRRIARKIVAQRRENPLRTAGQLAELLRGCVPRSRGHQIDPATRTFQALRIAVNDELQSLQEALTHLPDFLNPGGRLAIISFHSLEDRMVKHAFREDSRLEVLTRRPLRATDEEIEENPRASSAKLRVAERATSQQKDHAGREAAGHHR